MSDKRTVVITGGGSGIGRATANNLAKLGNRVIVVDRDARAARDVASEVGGDAVVGDLGEDVDAIVHEIFERTHALWGLVNSAGFLRAAPLVDQTAEDIDAVWRVNLRAPMLLSIALLPLLSAGGGSIVNVTSISGLHAHPGAGMYSPSKFGLIGFTNLCALEFAEHGVRANAICPGLVRTPMSEHTYLDPEVVRLREEAIPLGRISTPQHSADAITFLLSDEAEYISGAALEVDGGISRSLMTHFP